MGKAILKTIGIYVFVFIVMLLIVLYPRLPESKIEDITLENGQVVQVYVTYARLYSIEGHWNNIVDFFKNVIETKSLGTTRYNAPAEQEVLSSFRYSVSIIIGALVLSFIFGILKGFFDFKMQRKKWNILGNWTTWAFQSLPDFLIILFVQLLLVRYLPITQFYGREGWDAFILPAILVAIFPTMYIARITATALNGQSGKMYIQVARAKGLSEWVILFKHMFLNIIGTVLTHLSSLMVYILSNLVMVEFFMNYPGAALRLFRAVDYSPALGSGERYEAGVIIGILVCFMFLIFIVQLISQIARAYVEPRKVENIQ